MSPKKVFTAEQAKKVGEKLGVDWSKYDVEQFRVGMDVELEHGKVDPHTNVTDDDPVKTGKIALAHLNEFPDYYTRLLKLEHEAEAYWENMKFFSLFLLRRGYFSSHQSAMLAFSTISSPSLPSLVLRMGLTPGPCPA